MGIAKKLLDEFNDEEKLKIKSWAEEAYVIRNDDSKKKKDKIIEIQKITSKNKIVTKFFKALFKLIKKHTWDERGLAGRFALGGLTLGVAVSGSKMAGVASAGIGIGVPVYLLTTAGGALLGTIIDEIKNNN